MDADCLIKLTKAGLKEYICKAFDITIPHLVKEEIVDKGKVKGLPDAIIIDNNIKNSLIHLRGERSYELNEGEKEAVALFQKGGFDAIGSDDKRFIKQLHIFNIPYIMPAIFIALMLKQGDILKDEAEKKLTALSEYISENEYYTVKQFIGQWRE